LFIVVYYIYLLLPLSLSLYILFNDTILFRY